MSSPLKVKKIGKENEFIGSPQKIPNKATLFHVQIESVSQQLSKKETLS